MRNTLFPAFVSGAALVLLGAVAACGGSSDDSEPAPAEGGRVPKGTSAPGSNSPNDTDGRGTTGTTSKPTAAPTATLPANPTVLPSVIPTFTPPYPTPEPDNSREFEFSYEGVPGPIKAKVASDGTVTLDAWPTALFPVVRLMESPNRRLDDTFCVDVEMNARFGKFDSVRDRFGFVVSIDALPTATNGFRNAALMKAIPLSSGLARITQRPKLVSAKPRIVLEDGAITSILGGVYDLNLELRKLPVSTETAQMTGEIFARDLVCDLRSGKAAIVFDVTTDNPDYRPQVKTSGFEDPL